ncbi:amidase [Rhizobium sp. RM]|uniref:amidase n=1 Tax=Rhizobium sp. RM TaxID=2748079 RepID=UPI00110D8715|nr:amidase [Rhizobium sp. RM]NWJ23800.1 amidase [Rhizobium sp. RM]TMV19619.1 amidase [Rhizobium sp. Td3]
MTDLHQLNTLEILALYAEKKLSPSEYWQSVEARIAAFEPVVNALYAYDPEDAQKQAAASTDRWQKGETVGPLDGIPVSLKELIATKGQPIPLGTKAVELVPAAEDAPVAARCREDGAIIYAKTTCPDYGMLSSGLSSFHKLSRNPWDPSQNPGGSSAGAASAGAASYGTLHIGTDIGGSVRLPAGWTGLFGFKPSQGRIPVDPYYTGRCAGPMTRSVVDSAYAMATLSRPDWRDGTSLPPNDINWMDLDVDVKGLKIGLMLDAGCGLAVDVEVREAVLAAAKLFEAAGAIVVPVEPVLTRDMLDGLDDFWRAKFWGDIVTLSDERRASILPYIHEWAVKGADVSGARAVFGFNQTMEMRKSCGRLMQTVDAVISPTNPIVSYPADWASPTNDPQRPFEHIAFTVPWNMSEQPASSINCGFSTSGMPIGLQIVGPRYADLLVLKLSKVFEDWTGGVTNWPEPPQAR